MASKLNVMRGLTAIARDEDTLNDVAKYCDELGAYANLAFNTVDYTANSCPTTADVFAVSLLGVPTPPQALRLIPCSAAKCSPAHVLSADPDAPLWDLDYTDLQMHLEAFRWIKGEITGAGEVWASKFLARRHPHQIPIWDQRVRDFFGSPKRWWTPLKLALQEHELRNELAQLHQRSAAMSLSLVRFIDIAAWMRGSKRPSIG